MEVVATPDREYPVPQQPMGPADGTKYQSTAISGMREFYDPIRSYRTDQDELFLDRIASSRRELDVPKIGRLAGQEIMLVETRHALLRTIGSTTLTAEREQAVLHETDIDADIAASVVADMVNEIYNQNEGDSQLNHGLRSVLNPSKLILAGKVMAAIAHEGVTRKTRRKYFEHPNEVASIIGMAWHLQYKGKRESELEGHQFVGYTHDGYEDLLDRNGAYLARNGIMITPLVAQLALEKLDINSAEALELGRTLFYFARPDSIGGRMAYQPYIYRGIRLAGKRFIIPKSADNGHNHYTEPSPPSGPDLLPTKKQRKKLNEYTIAEEILKKSTDQFDEPHDLSLSLVVESIFHLAQTQIQAVRNYPKYKIDSEAVAKAARQKFNQRRREIAV